MLLAEPSRPAVYLHPYPTLHGITYVGMRMVNTDPTFCWGYYTDTQMANAKLHALIQDRSCATKPCAGF